MIAVSIYESRLLCIQKVVNKEMMVVKTRSCHTLSRRDLLIPVVFRKNMLENKWKKMLKNKPRFENSWFKGFWSSVMEWECFVQSIEAHLTKMTMRLWNFSLRQEPSKSDTWQSMISDSSTIVPLLTSPPKLPLKTSRFNQSKRGSKQSRNHGQHHRKDQGVSLR